VGEGARRADEGTGNEATAENPITFNTKGAATLIKNPFTPQKPLIGVDIQPDAIRLVQQKTQQTFHFPLPPHIFSHHKITNWDALTAFLTEQIHTNHLQQSPTAISIPTHLVRTARITLPAHLTDPEIEADIFMHMKEEMPGLSEAIHIDFSRLPTKDSSSIEVVYTAVRENHVLPYLTCMQSAGLNVNMIDVDCYALQRALNLSSTPHHLQGILQIKNHVTEFMIFDHHALLFHQQWMTTSGTLDLSQLKDCLQLFAATFRQNTIDQLILCVSYARDEALANEIAELADCSVFPAVLSPPITIDFLVASGLARRELPLW
jgi:hypothetical protein